MGLIAASATALAFAVTPANAQVVGVAGTDVGNGDITNSPGYALTGGPLRSYNYVTTAGSTATPAPVGTPPITPVGAPPYINGGFTNGSTDTFTVNLTTGEHLFFNFVTTDGTNTLNNPYPPVLTPFEDYAWATINGMVIYQAQTTVTPVHIGTGANGGPVWNELGAGSPAGPGASSGSCWGVGCGYTGWTEYTYTGPSGAVVFSFGVLNANDNFFDSGLAVATPGPVPGAGVIGLAALLCAGLSARARGLLV